MPRYQTTAEIRMEISRLRGILRERKAKALGHSSNKGRTFTKDGHEYLYGERAKLLRRIEIFRNAGGEVALFEDSSSYTAEEIRPAICQGCVEPHYIGWNDGTGEWHHNVKSKGGRRCDCAACGMFVCPMIHEAYRHKVIPVIVREPASRQKETANG